MQIIRGVCDLVSKLAARAIINIVINNIELTMLEAWQDAFGGPPPTSS